MAKWKKVLLALVITYTLVWFTDSIWEYIPESKPHPSISTPSPQSVNSTPVRNECDPYYDVMGEYVQPCAQEPQEDPGWQGR